MATLVMPSQPGFAGTKFGLLTNSQTFVSPLSGETQTQELPGARWTATYALPAMPRAQAAAWTAFLAGLLGEAGRFFGFDPDARNPQGLNLGTPLVMGAGQSGKTLTTDGWSANETGLLLPGDYMEVNGELKMLTAQVDSDGAGQASISFVPSLRVSPADNDPLITLNPRCIMKLIDDEQGAWDASNVSLYGIQFRAVEAFT